MLKNQVEERLSFFESGELPRKNIEVMQEAVAQFQKEKEQLALTPSVDVDGLVVYDCVGVSCKVVVYISGVNPCLDRDGEKKRKKKKKRKRRNSEAGEEEGAAEPGAEEDTETAAVEEVTPRKKKKKKRMSELTED